jgi:hypothetical protein
MMRRCIVDPLRKLCIFEAVGSHPSQRIDRGQGQKRFAKLGRRQGVSSQIRSGRSSGADSKPVRREQRQPSILTRAVRPGSRSARALQSYYFALDKPRPDEEPNGIGSKAKTAIADYDKAIGRPAGLAELSIFYCEEAFGFVESCSFGDERYFIALIRMYDR